MNIEEDGITKLAGNDTLDVARVSAFAKEAMNILK